jgi:hypothetical protein
MLLLDETSFLKKGTYSIGVARQYCGCSGKIENGQVAVLGALGCGQDAILGDYRLYLPESWTADDVRLNRAKVPTAERAFSTKPELALKIVETAVANKLQFGWVGMDSLYGANQKLLKALEDRQLQYMGDVRSNQKFYFRDTHGIVHRKCVDKIWRDEAPNLAENVGLPNSTKRTLKAQVLVIVLCDEAGQTNGRRLVISCHKTGAIKYSLSNAQGSAQQLCYRQHQRYWIQEAKTEVGMAQY